MDDRKQFDKLKYIESPLINSYMLHKYREINGESVERSPLAIQKEQVKIKQFETLSR